MNAISFIGNKADASVLEFAVWWLKHRPIVPPQNALRKVGNLTGLVLYREGQFQVQLFTAVSREVIPHHTHPNVESLEKLVCGEIDLNTARGEKSYNRKFLEINHDDDHWGSIDRGAFFSFQKWLNGVTPTSVDLDWSGEPIDEQHGKDIGNG